MDEIKTEKKWLDDIKRILYFWLKTEIILMVIAIILLVLNLLLGNINRFFSTETIKAGLDILGGVSILCGFVFLVLFSLTSDRRFVVRSAARFRAPNQLSYSRDILKRQMDDWHRAIGSALILVWGFLILAISYRLF